MFDRVICQRHDNGGVLWFDVFIPPTYEVGVYSFRFSVRSYVRSFLFPSQGQVFALKFIRPHILKTL